LYYRHVHQSEAYEVVEMPERAGVWSYAIPGEYTDSAYPLLYYFELLDDDGHAWLYPGFEPDLANQPYFVVRKG
jgi:hypothetical protein